MVVKTEKRGQSMVSSKMMNPFHQNFGHILALKTLIQIDSSNIVSMVSFTKRCKFKVDLELRKIQSNELIVYDIELPEFISRKLNVLKLQNDSPAYSETDIEQMYQLILKANITETKVRDRHVQALKAPSNNNNSNNSDKQQRSIDSTTRVKCKVCGTTVTAKVKEYCLTNRKRFNGEVYCFEHQKKF